jgi:hypothetical protein
MKSPSWAKSNGLLGFGALGARGFGGLGMVAFCLTLFLFGYVLYVLFFLVLNKGTFSFFLFLISENGIISLTLCLSYSCKSSDWSLRVLYKCPCADQPVAISTLRQQETYLNGAFWVSGVLQLISPSGGALFIWQPYSFAELRSKLGNLDTYLECMSTTSENCVAPTDPIFEKQQVRFICLLFVKWLSDFATGSVVVSIPKGVK